ncbi:secondary carrier transporter [Lithospermum erythrorhizon]|uniref:Secondary carrier transporter n=1 Tax=Lithospermum erythrorhizon TaxID=34254 RepID=A0AAV3RKA6_LITER
MISWFQLQGSYMRRKCWPRLITKVANDSQGKGILNELQADGVDTSYIVVSEEGNSSFTYIIVDNQMRTRTCIHTPGDPPMVPEDLTESNLFSALGGARLVYFDARLHETAVVIGEESAFMLRAKGIGTIGGRLLMGTAEKIPSSELVDTTGAGDAFIGAVL